jgi:hypothetical protein
MWAHVRHMFEREDTHMERNRSLHVSVLAGVSIVVLASVAAWGPALAQTAAAVPALTVQDPGVRGGAAGAGGMIDDLSVDE